MASNFPELPNLNNSRHHNTAAVTAITAATAVEEYDYPQKEYVTSTLPLPNHQDLSPVAPVRALSIRGVFVGKKSIPTPEDLGYEDAAPTTTTHRASPTTPSGGGKASMDAGLAADLGYGSGSPTVYHKTHTYDRTRVPRRSSLKGGAGPSSSIEARLQRRASMGCSATTLVEVRIRGERYPIHRRRSIDFNQTVTIKEVTKVTDESPMEEIWLQPEDFAQMKLERRAVVRKHKSGQVSAKSEDHDSIRGLEKYLDRSGKILKNRAWDTVLLEQDEQELSGVFNDQRIADLYKSTTYSSPEKAAERAQQDHESVKEYLMSPRTTKLMMRRLSC